MGHYTVVSFVATACIVFYTIFYIMTRFGRRRRLYEQASKFPGPLTLPIIGHAHLLIGSTEVILNRISQMSKLYPSPYRFWIGNYLTFVVNTPEQLKIVLHSPKTMDKGPLYDFGKPWLGAGLLTAPAAIWRVHRKLMQPTFNPRILQSFIGIFATRSAIMAKEMERNVDGPEFEIINYTSRYALHAICETTMGVDLGNQTNDNDLYAKAVEKVAVGIFKRAFRPWLYPNFIFDRTQLGKKQQKYIEYLHNFTDNVLSILMIERLSDNARHDYVRPLNHTFIELRIRAYELGKYNLVRDFCCLTPQVIETKKKKLLEQSLQPGSAAYKEDDTGYSGVSSRKILLDHLLEATNTSEILRDETLREEVDTMIAAGSDTTAIMSSYVLLMLSSHPEIQDKVHQELCEIYGDDDSEELRCTPEDLTRMSYLDRVIKETLRLFPIAPCITRRVAEDLDIGEYILPKESLLVLSIIDLHRNEKYWPDPLKFDPDRFLPEEVEKREPYTYLPFSGGPRSCIGIKYAMMSMKILLATILRKYVLKQNTSMPVKDLRLKCEFLLRPVNPITLRIEKRTRI